MARSNRQLTQFAVHRIGHILDCGSGILPESDAAGNTEISTCFGEAHVKLFGEKIMSLSFKNRQVSEIIVQSGNFYDSKGRPSRTTRERLNGLLDLLGDRGVIPEGIRVFLKENGSCCIGKGDTFKQFDARKPVISMLSHPDNLVFS